MYTMAAAKEISMDAAVAEVLVELHGVIPLWSGLSEIYKPHINTRCKYMVL